MRDETILQERLMVRGQSQEQEYWTKKLSGELVKSSFPYDYIIKETNTTIFDFMPFQFTGELFSRLMTLSKGSDYALFVIAAAGVTALLAKYSGNEDIILAAPIDKQEIRGEFINTVLTLRNRLRSEMTFKELLIQVRQTIKEAAQHQNYPLEALLYDLNMNYTDHESPLFDVAILLENIHDKQYLQHIYPNITFLFDRSDNCLQGNLKYNSSLYSQSTITKIITHFTCLIKKGIFNVEQRLSGLNLLTESEKKQLLFDFNGLKPGVNTTGLYPGNPTVLALFEEQVQNIPYHTALVFQNEMLTWKELSAKADQLAYLLIEKGVQPDTIVGIMTEPSVDLIIGIFAILKAGGAFLPIDPADPPERIKYMLNDSKAKILLTSPEDNVKEISVESIDILNLSSSLTFTLTPTCRVRPTNLAYIIYTSGTSGRPKGVLVEHKGIANLTIFFKKILEINEKDRILQFARITFDASVSEFFMSLSNGASLYLTTKKTIDHYILLEDFLQIHNITVVTFPPTYLVYLNPGKINSLRKIITAGSETHFDLVRRWKEKAGYINAYGPTETSVCASLWQAPRETDEKMKYSSVPIGTPILNTQIYMLDRDRQPVPLGIPGELCVGGVGVARGYLNKPELTAQKFCLRRPGGTLFEKTAPPGPPRKNFSLKGSHKNHMRPCNHAAVQPCSRAAVQLSPIYLTGDLARWLPDGNIEFLGRIDLQVKIRGFRIELEEILDQLLKHENIKEAVVIDRVRESGDKYLCAYLVTNDVPLDDRLTAAALREYLSRTLPAYMIPSYFVPLDKMPLTPNGKINRKELPLLTPGVMGEDSDRYAAPGDEIEKQLVEIWRQVLEIEKENLSIDANFFDLGGHSLKATLLVSRIHKELDARLDLVELFKNPTIRELARLIKKTGKNKYASLKPLEKKEYYSLSSAQKRMYVLQQMDIKGTGYNLPFVIPLGKNIKINKLETTLKKLINRHESLKTFFLPVNEIPVQKVQDEVKFEIEYYDLHSTRVEGKVGDYEGPGGLAPLFISAVRSPYPAASLISSFIRPFNLSRAPLLRSGLIKLPDENYAWILDIHHIIVDGTSQTILTEDFISLYNGEKLPPLELQYKDFSQWQNQLFTGGRIESQEKYWLELYADAGTIPRLDLPADFKRPEVFTFAGDTYGFKLEREDAARFKALGSWNNGTLYMNFLAALDTLFYKYTGQTDIIIGTTTASRPHADLQQIVGMFVNTLAMRNQPQGEKTYTAFLKEVIDHCVKAFENQDIQFEELINKLELKRDPSRNPLFDISLVIQNFRRANVDNDVLTQTEKNPGIIPAIEFKNPTAKFDMTFFIQEQEEDLHINIQYYTGLFKQETIRRLAVHLKNIIKSIVTEPFTKLKDIEMISAAERNQLLYQWNDTAVPYPYHKTIHRLFKEQVQQNPDQVALVDSEPLTVAKEKKSHLTYKELNQQSNQLTSLLKKRGVREDTIVALLLDRSIEMIVGILSILKAGGAYMPIDPDYPEERIQYMLIDANIKFLVEKDNKFNELTPGGLKRWPVETISLGPGYCQTRGKTPSPEPAIETYSQQSAACLAYVIYTSGTTGKPRGVLIQHQNVVRLLFNDKFQFDFSPSDVWTMFHSYSFDFSVWEMYGALLYGGKLILMPGKTAKDPVRLLELLKKENVTILNQTPAAFYNLAHQEIENPTGLLNLRYVIFGGEALNPVKLKKWRKKYPGTRLINMYGITETTVHVTFKELEEEDIDTDSCNIGQPIPTLSVYLLDKHLALVPKGVPGELCVGGEGVGRGYLNQPDLSSQKFTANPYKPGQRLYRSGDLAKFTDNNDLEYLGRLDHQVKIRGFRIEAGEIENQLLKHQDVKETVVVAREDESGNKYLCAYIVSPVYKETGLPGLKQYLSKYLPDYMIPSYFEFLEQIPLTPNGKVDRKALPCPGVPAAGEYTAPLDEVERELARLWKEVLPIPLIGRYDNFFDLGGHSLNATTLVSKINKVFNINMSLVEIFTTPTIRGLAGYIKGAGQGVCVCIEAAEKKEYFPMSSAQKRLYILQQMDETSTGYNVPFMFHLEGDIHEVKFENTFRSLIRRHESFRTSFRILDEQPVQVIHNDVSFALEYDVHPFIRPFDLSRAPLLRVAINKSEKGKCILMLDMHHIISDGLSANIIAQEFGKLYEGKEVSCFRLRYKDFSQWQNNMIQSGEMKKREIYWLNQFEGEIPVLDLPIDHKRPPLQRFEGSSIGFKIGKSETQQLKQLAANIDATPFMLLLAVLNLFLSKLCGQEDIVIGTPIAGRNHYDLENIIGMFVNTLALRNYPTGDKTFNRFLKEVKERTLEAFENQDYQYEELVEKVVKNRDMSRSPLFDVMFVFQNIRPQTLQLQRLKITPHPFDMKLTKFDMVFGASEQGNNMFINVEYAEKLFKKETIQQFIHYLRQTITSLLENPGKKLEEIEIIPTEEKSRILHSFNNTTAEFPGDQTLHGLFTGQAAKTPDHSALVGNNLVITYRQLNERSNQLAHLLKEKGVKPDIIVGLMVERSVEMIVGIMAILKAGGAYLPIDAAYPEERINYMLTDSRIKILLTNQEEIEKWNYLKEKIVNSQLSIVSSVEIHPDRGVCQDLHLSPAHVNCLAYIIYTSGSTGQPKGVLIRHQGVVNVVTSFTRSYQLTPRDRILQQTSISFDVSVNEIFPVLSNGGAVVLAGQDSLFDLEAVVKIIRSQYITIISASPSLLSRLNDMIPGLPGLRLILSGGEALTYAHVQRLSQFTTVVNGYGPTETTICASSFRLDPTNPSLSTYETISIGKPLMNYRLYILDRNLSLVPVGLKGELCITGIGLARGYLNRPELTSLKFVRTVNRHSSLVIRSSKKLSKSTNDRLYKTGDLARWLTDGNIQFLGRIDEQIKVRGFRIELGEIETQLLKHNAVKDAVVLTHDDEAGDKYLCAYIVPCTRSGKNVTLSQLSNHLSKYLPFHMIPSFFVFIHQIPLTASGKVDKKALPDPDTGAAGSDYIAPRNEMEEKLVKIWAESLKRHASSTPIGIDDNFFLLGGHSLKALALVSRIHKELNVKVPLPEIFKAPTIRKLTGYIKHREKETYISIEPVETKEYYVMSSPQKRLYFLQQMDEMGTAYNISSFVYLERINRHRLEDTIKKLIHRHESLRTSFHIVRTEPVHRIHDKVEFEIEHYDLTTGGTGELAPLPQQSPSALISSFIRPFDLSRAPLLRVGLANIPGRKLLFMVDMHHIISDGISTDVLIKDFTHLDRGEELAVPRIQYKDFAEWQNTSEQRIKMKQQEAYWLLLFKKKTPVLDLPTDYPRPTFKSYEGRVVEFALGVEQSRALNDLALETETTLYMVLLTIFCILLSKLSGQEDITVGTPTAGRSHADLENIIGMFANIVVTRNYPKEEKSVADFLKEVKQGTLDAFQNQDYPFENLVEQLKLSRNSSRNPLFDVMFSVQNFRTGFPGAPKKMIDAGNQQQYQHKTLQSKFDITLTALPTENGLSFAFLYSKNLFKKETIDHFIDYFKKIVSAVLADTNQKMAQIQLVSEDERKRLTNKIKKRQPALPNQDDRGNQKRLERTKVQFDF